MSRTTPEWAEEIARLGGPTRPQRAPEFEMNEDGWPVGALRG